MHDGTINIIAGVTPIVLSQKSLRSCVNIISNGHCYQERKVQVYIFLHLLLKKILTSYYRSVLIFAISICGTFPKLAI